MAEKPILFSTDMVQAILEGRKTQTRRVVKGLPINQSDYDLGIIKRDNGSLTGYGFEKIPYQPGDILWVRETWARLNGDYRPDNNGKIYIYKADHVTGNDGPDLIRWRPSIHMPREAARLFLTVKDVRVERLQDISEDDARAEGCHAPCYDAITGEEHSDNRTMFKIVWNSLNAKPEYTWESNPWVWVIIFE